MNCFHYFSAQGDLVKVCPNVVEGFTEQGSKYSKVFDIYDTYQFIGEQKGVRVGDKIDYGVQKFVLPFHPYSDYEHGYIDESAKSSGIAQQGNTNMDSIGSGASQSTKDPNTILKYDPVNTKDKLACRKDIPCCDECKGDCKYCIQDSYCCTMGN